MPTDDARLGFVDAMKALGISLIVYGHIANFTILHLLPPVRPKQLGVAFFVFTLGYCLAREARPVRRVLFNRVFEIYLIGLAFALVSSLVMFLAAGTIQRSNYMPFFLGVNVAFDFFPANPTTWYIGTYLHLLILWALLLRRIHIRAWMLPLCLVLEVLLRAWLLQAAGLYIAYMFLGNWLTLLMVGMYLGRRAREKPHGTVPGPRWLPVAAVGGMAAWLWLWPMLTTGIDRGQGGFPFMVMPIDSPVAAALVLSLAVSGIYLLWTLLVFVATRPLPSLAINRFFARHTLFIFIAHMPVIYLLQPIMEAQVASQPLRIVLMLAICLPGLALVSEGLARLVDVKQLRDRTWGLLHRLTGGAQAAGAAPPTATIAIEPAGKREAPGENQ